ncbi:sulfatase-like hydrolase/transferase [Proteiniphilum sp.]|uniref:sulfatase-like hydrolase/transferase n=1 Tax=Proteiniphilum sp. TaxID=1926877 RepID=UPI00332A5A86
MNTKIISVIGVCALYGSKMLAQQPIMQVNHNDSPVVMKEIEKVYGKPPAIESLVPHQPSILLITSDQQFWMGMGYNDPILKTPNLDRLVEMGTIYNRAYTCNPVSTPTRCSIITGLYPSQHGAYALGTKLPENVPCIGDYLSQVGYTSILVGKAHFQPLAGNAIYPSLEAYPILQDLNFWKKYNGPFYGFDHVELARDHGDESHVGQHYALWMIDKLKKEGRDPEEWKQWFIRPGVVGYANVSAEMQKIMDKNGAQGTPQRGAWNIPEEYHLNAWIAERTNANINEMLKEGKPFFIWASFFDPHPPYLVPEPWASMYDPAEIKLPEVDPDDLEDMPYHYRMTQTGKTGWGAEFDEDGFSIHGLHNQKTTKEQLAANKAIYYGMISMMDKYIGQILDNLERAGQLENTVVIFTTDHGHHIGTHNLTAKGGFAFEEDLRIPFIVSWKGHYPQKRQSDALISLVDLVPSFLKLAGREIPMTVAGIDVTPIWAGEKDKIRDWVFAENRFQRTKFYQKTYIEERYKITWYMQSDEGELFDLENDPDEFHNLWDDPKYQTLKMEMMHKALKAEMQKEPCWMPRVAPA